MVTSIPLSKTGKHAGKYEAIVDDCDSDLAELNWSVLYRPNRKVQYARRTIYIDGVKVGIIKLHRVILERMIGRSLETDEFPDHIDGDGLRNTRDNLRLATNSQNLRNRGIPSNNTSGYKGVSFHKASKKWQASIGINEVKIHLGLFNSPEEAYRVYCEKAKEIFKDFVHKNS